MIDLFKSEVEAGLLSNPKTLPSKYFYDAVGNRIFQEIMAMPEYYLTRAEAEVLTQNAYEIVESFAAFGPNGFDLIELGAGDGTKTMILLKLLVQNKTKFTYKPIDISQHAIAGLTHSLRKELPELDVQGGQGTYFNVLDEMKHIKRPKVVLFLGSNIGNLMDNEASRFIHRLGENMIPGDKLFLGVDLIKSKEIVLPAYNDAEGITSRFNLNLLTRINRELGANFDITEFYHMPEYEEEEGIARSSIVSRVDQDVHIKALKQTFSFNKDERIHTEISRKYNRGILESIIGSTDFKIVKEFFDSKHYFCNVLLQRQ